jgi:hypothetical protein
MSFVARVGQLYTLTSKPSNHHVCVIVALADRRKVSAPGCAKVLALPPSHTSS